MVWNAQNAILISLGNMVENQMVYNGISVRIAPASLEQDL
jgi:hypothetical protein